MYVSPMNGRGSSLVSHAFGSESASPQRARPQPLNLNDLQNVCDWYSGSAKKGSQIEYWQHYPINVLALIKANIHGLAIILVCIDRY